MQVNKAIEILSDPDPDIDCLINDDYKDAIKLSIEALKRIRGVRHLRPRDTISRLPGETKE